MTGHVPCAVVATMAGPVALERPCHLDALLYAARFRALGPSSFGTPLAEVAEERGLPRASASFLVAGGLGGTRPVERTRPRLLNGRKGDFDAVDHGSGPVTVGPMSPHRNALTRWREVEGVGFLVWHALADPEAVLRLVSTIRFVGANAGTGSGAVEAWEVSELPDADPAAVGWFHRGRPCRRLPTALVAERLGSVPGGLDAGVRRPTAPYHATDGAVPCVEPWLSDMTARRSELSALT